MMIECDVYMLVEPTPRTNSYEMKNKYLTDHKLERNKNWCKTEINSDGNLAMKEVKVNQARGLSRNEKQNLTVASLFDVNPDIKKSNKFFVIKITFMCVTP